MISLVLIVCEGAVYRWVRLYDRILGNDVDKQSVYICWNYILEKGQPCHCLI